MNWGKRIYIATTLFYQSLQDKQSNILVNSLHTIITEKQEFTNLRKELLQERRSTLEVLQVTLQELKLLGEEDNRLYRYDPLCQPMQCLLLCEVHHWGDMRLRHLQNVTDKAGLRI